MGLTMVLSTLLSGCSSTPGPGDIPRDTEFSTQILADGTKIFLVKTSPHLGRGERKGGGGEGRGGNNCFPCEPGEQRGGFGSDDRENDLKRAAKAMIAENHYCRDGFVVLEEYHQDRGQILRGECRDTADESDRARFSHAHP
jgi:hypothetical protein